MQIADIQRWFLTLSERKKQMAMSAASILAGTAILIGYFSTGPNALEVAQAEAAFAKWRSSPEDDQLYHSMKEAIRAVPALQKKHEAAIAQTLINTDRFKEALLMANRSLDRVKEEIPFHSSYAMTSLLIEQGEFQKALEDAVALKERMGSSFLKEEKGGSLLYVHNLLRIASLQQALKNRPGEKAALEELESFLQTKNRLAQTFLDNFSEKEVDLTQYIVERKKAL